MPRDYFNRLRTGSPTRVWVNNPTIEEIGLALEQGAAGCTTNPAYGGNLLQRAPDEVLPIIAECARLSDDPVIAADLVQQRLVARIVQRFLPLFEASEGREGYVSIQGAPEADTDAAHILEEAREGHAIGPNATPKIPATKAGLEAFEVIVADGYPVIVTEVFSLAQLIETSERYLQVTARTGTRPPFFMSPITGIFGDHLKALAARDGLPISADDMELAGVALTRECYRIVRERDYPVTLLAGGARIPLDLTGLVGGFLHATINWATFAEVIADPSPFSAGIDDPLDQAALARLDETFVDFHKSMLVDGLTLDEFAAFGPVLHFRDNFILGWKLVQEAIAVEQASVARTGAD